MFVLAELKDTVRIPPHLFHIAETEAIKDEINRKLANKVMIDVGLCITMHSLVDMGDSMLLPGDGSFHTDVKFRYIVFRPTLGNVITGKIRSCSREGVHVTLGFFDDILIPAHLLQYPVRFEEAEQAWVWEYPLDADNKHDLYMDIGEPIKFRVVKEIFEECSPVGPVKGVKEGGVSAPVTTEIKIPYRIIGAINEPGLGVLSWWDQHNDLGGEEEDEEVQDDETEEQENDNECDNNDLNETNDDSCILVEEGQENNEITEELLNKNNDKRRADESGGE